MSTLSIGTQAGIPRTWEVADRSFKVSGVTFHQLATLNDHLRSVVPHPVDRVKALLAQLGDLAEPEDRRRLTQEAIAEVESGAWPPTFDSFAGDRYYFGTPDGIATYLLVILAKHQPDLTFEEVRRSIAPKASLKDLEQLSILIELITEEELAARKARRLAASAPEATGPRLAPEPEPGPVLHTESGAPEGPKGEVTGRIAESAAALLGTPASTPTPSSA